VFGVYRVYVDRPSRFPSETETLPSVADSPHFSISKRSSEADPTCVFGPRVVSEATSYKPFNSISTLRAMEAFYGHTELSTKALDEIIAITQTEDFDVSHWEHFSTATQMQRMDKFIASKEAGPNLEGTFGWKHGAVTLRLPAKDVKQREATAVAFMVEGILYRDLLDVVKSFYGSPTFEEMHLKHLEKPQVRKRPNMCVHVRIMLKYAKRRKVRKIFTLSQTAPWYVLICLNLLGYASVCWDTFQFVKICEQFSSAIYVT